MRTQPRTGSVDLLLMTLDRPAKAFLMRDGGEFE